MEITKGKRHTRVIGEFGENIICNWLSRSGFEVAVIDHVGIDIIACSRSGAQKLGITVKSRTRNAGKERTSASLFRGEKDRGNLKEACQAFGCEPWIGVYIETENCADIYLTSLEHYDEAYRGNGNIDSWKMGEKEKRRYDDDAEVHHIGIDFKVGNWGLKGAKPL